MTQHIALIALLSITGCIASAPTEATQPAEAQALTVTNPTIGSCSVIRCKQGYVCKETCDGARCVPVLPDPSDAAVGPECAEDADCRLLSDYCEGCNCLALGADEAAPVCKGSVVQCLVDPCRNLEARCEHGSCVVGQPLR